jgi:hypothetical protein
VTLVEVAAIAGIVSPVFWAGVFWQQFRRVKADMNGIAKRQRDFERVTEHKTRRVLHVLADVCEGEAYQRILRILVGE